MDRPMPAAISIEQAQAKLKELIHQMAPGEELVITENALPIAKLVSESLPQRKRRQPGRCKGMITLQVEDDEHLKDLAGYMPCCSCFMGWPGLSGASARRKHQRIDGPSRGLASAACDML